MRRGGDGDGAGPVSARDSSSTVAGRPARSLIERVFATELYARTLRAEAPSSLLCRPADPAPGDQDFANALFQGRYLFRGEQRTALNEPPWSLRGASDVWRAEVNAFEWLADFRATESETGRLRARELARSWIDLNDRWRALSWRPDVLGRRLASWSCHADYLCHGADPTFRRRFLTSFHAQARHLSRVAGVLSPDRWTLPAVAGRLVARAALTGEGGRLADDLRTLRRSIAREVLPDGVHASRNPDRTLAALRLLLIVRAALENVGRDPPDALADAIGRLALAARALRHGDGGFGNFNGGAGDGRGRIDGILAAARARGAAPSELPDGGYQRLSAGRTLVLFDVGAAGRGAASAFAGLLSFELGVGRDRVIVNCGADGGSRWREAGRTTAAHSTLAVADTNARDIFDRRSRRRAPPAVRARRREDGGNVLVEASHDGYVKRFGLRHDRAIYVSPDGDHVRGEDAMAAIGPQGGRARRFALRFHLHPRVRASLATDGVTVLLRPARGEGMRFRSSHDVALEESVYLGGAAGVRATRQIVVHGHTDPGGTETVKWALTLFRR